MSQSIYSDILQNIKTKENMDTLLIILTNLASGVYVDDIKKAERMLRQEVNISLGESIMKTMVMEGVNWKDYEKSSRFFAELKEEIQKMEVIEMVISFVPSQKSLNIFSRWVSDNLGKNIIIKTTPDPTVIGGAIIIYKGQYLDYSLKSYFDTKLMKNSDLVAILQ